jgi:hypothetical protein
VVEGNLYTDPGNEGVRVEKIESEWGTKVSVKIERRGGKKRFSHGVDNSHNNPRSVSLRIKSMLIRQRGLLRQKALQKSGYDDKEKDEIECHSLEHFLENNEHRPKESKEIQTNKLTAI